MEKADKTNPPGSEKNPPRSPLPFISYGETKRRVLELLKKGCNPHSMARRLNKHRSTIQQHLRELKNLGLAEKKNYLWYIKGAGLGGGFPLVGSERADQSTTKWLQQDRGHNVKIKADVLHCPNSRDWLKNWFANREMKNNVFYTQRFGEVVTTYTGKSLIFQLPIFNHEDSDTVLIEAGKMGMALCEKYEKDVPGLKLGHCDVKLQIITQHHAIPQDPWAKFCKKNNLSYHDESITIDASDTPEIEFTDPMKAHIHHEQYVSIVKDFATKDVPKLSEITHMIAKTQDQLYQLSCSQMNLVKLMTPAPKQKDLGAPEYVQ